jgi:hypothetical protein
MNVLKLSCDIYFYFNKFLLKRSFKVDTSKHSAAICDWYNAKPAEGRSGKGRHRLPGLPAIVIYVYDKQEIKNDAT